VFISVPNLLIAVLEIKQSGDQETLGNQTGTTSVVVHNAIEGIRYPIQLLTAK
jgi:hypothetical protein